MSLCKWVLPIFFFYACCCAVQVDAKKKHDVIGGYYLHSLFGLFLAIKAKVVLVMLAVWGGVILTVKVFLALLWPIISKWSHGCPFKEHHHGHGIEFEPSFFKHSDIEVSPSPPPEYLAYKRWNRRQSLDASLPGYR